LTAADLDEASRHLRGEGNVIVDLHEQEETAAPRRPVSRAKPRTDDVILFANQLAVMVDTGVPLAEALESITEQNASERIQPVLRDVCEQVKSGTEFSTALGRHPKVFGPLFVSMVSASEASGTMGAMLQRVARHLVDQRELKRQVAGAMAYPVAMLGLCALVVVGMLAFILPRFERIYAGKSAVLPGPTRALLGLSEFVQGSWPLLIGGAAVLIGSGWYYFRTPAGREMLDLIHLRMPILGNVFRRAALARSLRTLATMSLTGVNLLESLEITAGVTGNVHFARTWRRLAGSIRGGSTLSEEMARESLIPAAIARMVSAGERAGKLGSVLDRIAGFCEDDLKQSVRNVTTFIEPVMIITMGIVIGGIALALLLPVFSVSKVLAS
jgi:type IV pilus assembly protein PilC